MTDTSTQPMVVDEAKKVEGVVEAEQEEEKVVATADTAPSAIMDSATANSSTTDSASASAMDSVSKTSIPSPTEDSAIVDSAPADSATTVFVPSDSATPMDIDDHDSTECPKAVEGPTNNSQDEISKDLKLSAVEEQKGPGNASQEMREEEKGKERQTDEPMDTLEEESISATDIPSKEVDSGSRKVAHDAAGTSSSAPTSILSNVTCTTTGAIASNDETNIPSNATSPSTCELSISSTVTSIVSNVTSMSSNVIVTPSNVTATQSSVTATPSSVTATPSSVTATPSNVTATPSNVTATPSNVTDAASNGTDAPHNVTDSPSSLSILSSDETATLSNEALSLNKDKVISKEESQEETCPIIPPANIPSNGSDSLASDIPPSSDDIPENSTDTTAIEIVKTESLRHVPTIKPGRPAPASQQITTNITQPAQNSATEKTDKPLLLITTGHDGQLTRVQQTQTTVVHQQQQQRKEMSDSGVNLVEVSVQRQDRSNSVTPESILPINKEPGVHDEPVYSLVDDEVVQHDNVISIPEFADSDVVAAAAAGGGNDTASLALAAGVKLEPRGTSFTLPGQITLAPGNTLVRVNHPPTVATQPTPPVVANNLLAAAMAGANVVPVTTAAASPAAVLTPPSVRSKASAVGRMKIEPSALGMLKPPSTDALLKTAKEVLQLHDDPPEYKRVFQGPGPGQILVDSAGNILQAGPDHNVAICQNEVSGMEVAEENGAYILESVNGGEFYEDPNIMWIEETVEVEQESYDGLSPMVIILNPNGTVNEELMLANGMNMETIKAVTDAASGGLNLQTVLPSSAAPPPTNPVQSINALQHPIPKRLLVGVQPASTTAPRSIIEAASHETQRSVILDQKDDYLILDDIKDEDPMLTSENATKHQQSHRIININGTQHIITTTKPIPDLKKINNINVQSLMNTPMNVTPLGTLDLSMPKKENVETITYTQKSALDQFVNPSALVSEHTVLKVLDQPKQRNGVTKVRRPRMRDENGNGNPYIHRKTTSLGALGQALHGAPRDSRENAVQICPICKFQATTKNPYRHLQDHLARVHFKDRIGAELPTKKPYICPFEGCDGKAYPDWQAVMRHYIGKKHGILDKYVKEELHQIRRENGGRIPGTVIRPGVELML